MDLSESGEKILTFQLKIPTPTKRSLVYPFLNQLVIEHLSYLQATRKGNQLWSLNSCQHRHKNYSKLEWSLLYVEVDGVLLLIFATITDKGSCNQIKVSTMVKRETQSMKIVIPPISSLSLRVQWVYIVHSTLAYLLGVNYHCFYDWNVILVRFLSVGKMSCVTSYNVIHSFLLNILKLRWFAFLFKILLSKY